MKGLEREEKGEGMSEEGKTTGVCEGESRGEESSEGFGRMSGGGIRGRGEQEGRG